MPNTYPENRILTGFYNPAPYINATENFEGYCQTSAPLDNYHAFGQYHCIQRMEPELTGMPTLTQFYIRVVLHLTYNEYYDIQANDIELYRTRNYSLSTNTGKGGEVTSYGSTSIIGNIIKSTEWLFAYFDLIKIDGVLYDLSELIMRLSFVNSQNIVNNVGDIGFWWRDEIISMVGRQHANYIIYIFEILSCHFNCQINPINYNTGLPNRVNAYRAMNFKNDSGSFLFDRLKYDIGDFSNLLSFPTDYNYNVDNYKMPYVYKNDKSYQFSRKYINDRVIIGRSFKLNYTPSYNVIVNKDVLCGNQIGTALSFSRQMPFEYDYYGKWYDDNIDPFDYFVQLQGGTFNNTYTYVPDGRDQQLLQFDVYYENILSHVYKNNNKKLLIYKWFDNVKNFDGSDYKPIRHTAKGSTTYQRNPDMNGVSDGINYPVSWYGYTKTFEDDLNCFLIFQIQSCTDKEYSEDLVTSSDLLSFKSLYFFFNKSLLIWEGSDGKSTIDYVILDNILHLKVRFYHESQQKYYNWYMRNNNPNAGFSDSNSFSYLTLATSVVFGKQTAKMSDSEFTFVDNYYRREAKAFSNQVTYQLVDILFQKNKTISSYDNIYPFNGIVAIANKWDITDSYIQNIISYGSYYRDTASRFKMIKFSQDLYELMWTNISKKYPYLRNAITSVSPTTIWQGLFTGPTSFNGEKSFFGFPMYIQPYIITASPYLGNISYLNYRFSPVLYTLLYDLSGEYYYASNFSLERDKIQYKRTFRQPIDPSLKPVIPYTDFVYYSEPNGIPFPFNNLPDIRGIF